MSEDLVVVLDCGATNTRAIAVNTRGEIVSATGRPNEAVQQEGAPEGWLVWPLEEVYAKLGLDLEEPALPGLVLSDRHDEPLDDADALAEVCAERMVLRHFSRDARPQ